MVSLSKGTASWLERLGRSDDPLPTSSEELSRISQEVASTRARDDDSRVLASRGWLRLFGRGVDGHRASFGAVGEAMLLAQRAVTAIGAALEGQKSIKGRFSTEVAARTRLSLEAAPLPGSVLLSIRPEMSPSDDLYPKGEHPLFDGDQRTLADRSLEALIQVIMTASDSSADAEPLVQQIDDLGPRVAATLDGFAESLISGGFDIELAWSRPSTTMQRGIMKLPATQWLHEVVTGRDLDAEATQVSGRLHTISDVSKWVLETSDDGELVSIRANRLSQLDVAAARVGQMVTIDALVKQRVRPGGTTVFDYTAVSVTPMNDPRGTDF